MAVVTKLERLREFALDQHGLITTAQAVGEGVSHAELSTMVARDRLERVAHGVYRVPQVPETEFDQYQLAVLWAGLPETCLSHDTALAAWVLGTTMDHSVQRHAAGIKVPALDDPAMVEAGFGHYRRMCAGCHGTPGMRKRAGGFNPDPPELTEAAGDWKPNELFWITKFGVRMSAMPAWGVSHSDSEIWQIVAFTQKLPSMKPAEYQALNRQVPPMKMP